MTVPKRRLALIHSLCRMRLAPETFVLALLEALRTVIPSERNLFDWADENGGLARYFVEGALQVAPARHYFEHFHNRSEAEFMPTFWSLRDAPMGVHGAAELAHAQFFDSDLYHEVWRPQGLHTRIEGVVRDPAGRLLGSLVLYRGPGQVPFTRGEEEALSALLPAVGRALQGGARSQAVLAHPAAGGYSLREQASLLLSADGRVIGGSSAAPLILALMRGGIDREYLGWSLTAALAATCPEMFGHPAGRAGAQREVSQLERTNGFGRFEVHSTALWMDPQDFRAELPVRQVSLRWSEPLSVTLIRGARRADATAGQLLVASELLQGRSHTEVAEALGVGTSTVVDQLRKLYASMGVNNVQDLRRVLVAAGRGA